MLLMTWINYPSIEEEFWNFFVKVEEDFRHDLDANFDSNEERLTGMLAAHFVRWGRHYSKEIQNKVRPRKSWYITIDYEDMAKKRRERKYGADMAFILTVHIKGVLNREKAILVQCKKSNTKSWPFDEDQAKDLYKTTTEGYYFIYLHPDAIIGRGSYLPLFSSPYPTFIWFNRFSGILPVSVGQALGLKRATSFKTVIPLKVTASSSKLFPDFMLNDFIGCWAGEDLNRLRNVIEELIVPRHIIKIGLYTEM